jgi:uncharacterized protein YbaR (Trm112 family)
MAANPTPSDFVSAFAALSEQLACPACYGELRMDPTCLTCKQCRRVYPIVDGIPVLTPVVSDQ